jgi:hypothetical protein
MINITKSQPINLANAFEVPIKVKNGESVMVKSIEKLSKKKNALDKSLSNQPQTKHHIVEDIVDEHSSLNSVLNPKDRFDSLKEMIDWVIGTI